MLNEDIVKKDKCVQLKSSSGMRNQSDRRMIRDQLVTLEDLEQFKADLVETMKQLLKPGGTNSPKPWLKTHEVRKLLGISTGKLLTLRINGVIPYTRIGNVIYYKAEDIQKLFDNSQPRHL